MPVKCITKTHIKMKDRKIQISIRISKECHDAMIFLRSKSISPDKYLRDGGEALVIKMAEKNRFLLKKPVRYF